jgi:hypothetical protein
VADQGGREINETGLVRNRQERTLDFGHERDIVARRMKG